MASDSQSVDSGPVREVGRIFSLDLIRGVAVLGILLMDAVYFGLGEAPSFNLSAGGSETWLDWTIGVAGEVFVDQKFMGLFSMLFGAGMILFIDRASERGRRAVFLNLWRNGLPLAAVGVIVTAANDYSTEIAFIGQIPNTIGTIPASIGYMSLIILWSRGADGRLKRNLRAVGRMALTNYLMQTVLGLMVLGVLLGESDIMSRGVVLLFVIGVWMAQMWWSRAWLRRFQFGPAEWLWRVATYRSLQPLRRRMAAGHLA